MEQTPVNEYSCSIDMKFDEPDVESAVQILQSSLGCTEAKSGCVSCRICQDTSFSNRIRYTGIWCSEEEFYRHVKSDEFKRVLIAMDMCTEEPTVKIGQFSGETGLAFLHRLSRGP